MLLCRVALGKAFLQLTGVKMAHAPPGHHSVVGRPSVAGLSYAEYVIYRGEQAYPLFLITYLIDNPNKSSESSFSNSDNFVHSLNNQNRPDTINDGENDPE